MLNWKTKKINKNSTFLWWNCDIYLFLFKVIWVSVDSSPVAASIKQSSCLTEVSKERHKEAQWHLDSLIFSALISPPGNVFDLKRVEV